MMHGCMEQKEDNYVVNENENESPIDIDVENLF